jgi:minor extracellular serine protease Vpr
MTHKFFIRVISLLLALAITCDRGTSAQAAEITLDPNFRADGKMITNGEVATGKGVIVAILDRGIDWRHPDFIKPDGTTRIKWLLDMTGQNLCDGSIAAQEYSEAQINAALAGGPAINSRDAVGHGTVTTGLAVGNGSAYANGKYSGIAPEADLIIVKLTSEGAPAHDDQPEEIPFHGCTEEALTWLDEKVTALNQPVVALINSGVQWGPIDGTSAVSRKIDKVFGTSRSGRVYVAASGDEGANSNHAGGSYDNKTDTVVRLQKASADTSYMQLWYTGSLPAEITFTFDDGTIVGPVGPDSFINQNGIEVAQYAPGQEFYPWQSTSGDRAVWIRITGHSDGGSVRIRGLHQGAGRFNVYGDLSIVSFDDPLVPGRLTDYASTQSAIVAGAHVNLTSYSDIDGITQDVGGEGETGDLWMGSSCGPTREGRLYGVDLTAAGHNAFAAYAPDSYSATFRRNLIQDGGGWYGRAGATSGSAPIVVGAVALLLDVNPSLTASQVRQILRDSATTDIYTGITPNLCWGYGKLNIERALELASMTINEVNIDVKPGRFPNRIQLERHLCKHEDNLYVAILSTPDFDALTVDASSLELGNPQSSKTVSPVQSRAKDVDRDGDADMALTFSLCKMVNRGVLKTSTTELVLSGITLDGIAITGRDSVKVVRED